MSNPKCLRIYCLKTAHCRGLCQNHYSAESQKVRRGGTTWDRLVADGHALPDKRPTVSRLNIKKVLDARYRGTVEKDGWRAALYARYLEESL